MVRQEDKDKLLIHIEICMCYTVKRNLQIVKETIGVGVNEKAGEYPKVCVNLQTDVR